VQERNNWDAQTFGVRLERRLDAREGVVVDRHPGGVRHFKWPVFKVNVSLDSGMSGGPILELRGGEPIVRGVISGDLALADEVGVGSGAEPFASELWPILMMPASVADSFVAENGQPLAVDTILDMIRENLIADRGNTIANFIWELTPTKVSAGWRGVAGRVEVPWRWDSLPLPKT
jgi:hypothetical protein